ncbi:Ras-related protein Rab-18 [Halotydeus destructor]|nr:Ras-related protein Rab-18 [Halotydeus destructor]
MATQEKPLTTLKILVLGDQFVGKSSLVLRLVDKKFFDTTESTVGFEYKKTSVSVDNHQVALNIWDTAGQERFKTIAPNLYRGVDGAILVYDVNSQPSFDNIDYWLSQLELHARRDDVVKVLVGNKVDLVQNDRPVVRRERARRWTVERKVPLFFEASAKDDHLVTEAFEGLIKLTTKFQDEKEVKELGFYRLNSVEPELPSIKLTVDKPRKFFDVCGFKIQRISKVKPTFYD